MLPSNHNSREPSSCPPGRVMPRLSRCRSGRPPSCLPSAPSGAQSDPLPTDSPGAAPPSRRREPASADRHRGRRGRSPTAGIRRAAAAMLLGIATLLGAGPAWADTLVSTIGGAGVSSTILSVRDQAQAFTTGNASNGYTLTGIKVQWDTVIRSGVSVLRIPGAGQTVTAIVTDGLASTATTIATLTNPGTWTETSEFSAPSGTTLAANTTYYFIIEGTDGNLAVTSSDAEDSGAHSGWTVANTRSQRAAATSGLGGTWSSTVQTLRISVEGEGVGETFACSAASMERQVWTGTITVGVINALANGYNDLVGALDDLTFDVGGTTYTIDLISLFPAFGLVFSLTPGSTLGDAADNLVLHVGGRTYPLEDASYDSGTNGYAWHTDLPPAWKEYDHHCLALTELVPPGAPVLTAAAKTESIELEWTVADHGTSDISKFEYRIKESTDANYPTTNEWTTIGTASNTGGSATITGLTNGTTYNVQVRGVNATGNGTESNEITATPDAPPAIDTVEITSDPGADKTYIIGEDIVVTGTFDKNLTIAGSDTTKSPGYVTYRTDHGDAPNSIDHPEAECAIGTDTKTLVCTDNVDEGEYENDGIAVNANALTMNRPITFVVGPLGQRANVAHSGIAADSNHKIDGIKPTLITTGAGAPEASPDLSKIVLTFSEAIGTVTQADITVKKGTTDQTITAASIDSMDATKVVVTLSAALLSNDTNVTVDLAADAVKDVPGNGIAEVLGTSVSVEDTVAPTFVSAGTNGTDEVVLTYSEALNTTQPATSAFTVKVGGNNRGVDTVAISGSAVTLTLASAFRPGDTLTVAYAKPATNPIKDASSNANEADSLPETTVTNNLAATAPDAPRSLAAGSYHISTAPVRVAADIFELSWIIPWHNGSPIGKHQYRQAMGSSVPPSTTWTDIPNSAPGQPNDTDFNVTGLDADTEYTFEVRAVNGIEPGPAAAVTRRTAAPVWSFTLRDASNNNVTELTEGGDAATATVSITNNVRFGAEQTVRIEWGGFDITTGQIQGAGGVSTITIPAEGASGSLVISSPQRTGQIYASDWTQALTATLGDTEIASIDLTRVDDEDPPVASITQAPATVNEGGDIEIEVTLSVGYASPGAVRFTVTDTDGALSGTPPDREVLSANVTDFTVTLTAAENTTQNDGTRDVTFTLGTSTDIPYTLGTPPAVTSVTITVRDDDTPPLAPRNLTAQAGNTEATLRWDAPAAPTPDHEQPVLHYEYRVKVGTASFGSWTRFPNSDASTRSHKFTGLTNGTEYTYEVAAVNVGGRGTEAQKSVTPLVGVAVSFAAATLSVDEGAQATVTVTLATAPGTGETVTVQIAATQGAGLNSSEYSGVPSSVTFAGDETSKSFTVTTVDDSDDEPDRLLTFSFGTLPAGYVPGTHSQLVLTLVDDDVPIVSATFGAATGSVQEGTSVPVTVSLSQAPEREVALTIRATRGANLAAGEVDGVPSDVTFAADETSKSFEVTFADDMLIEGNETLTLTFGTFADSRVTQGANPQLVLTVEDDDGPPAAPDVAVQTGDGYAALSWGAVSNDSPVLRYEVRWRESDGGTFNAWQSAGTETSYRVEGLTNDRAYEFQVRAVNAHGNGEEVSAPGTPTERLTGIPKAPQWLRFADVTDSSRAELKWGRPSNGTDRATRNSASAPFSQIQGYRIEVCRTTCGDDANWYAVVANTGEFKHTYTHQVLAPGVIRENRYRVQAININGKTGPWSNVARLDPTRLERFWLVSPGARTVDVHLEVWHPDGNPLYVRYQDTSDPMSVRYKQKRLTKKGYEHIGLPVQASTHYKVEVDFVDTFDSPRLQSAKVWSLQEGAEPYKSPYAVDALDAQVYRGGTWRAAPDTQLTVRMGESGKYRVRLKPCSGGERTVLARRIEAPAGALRASPMDVDPFPLTLDCGGDEPGDWKEVTVTALALEDYDADVRADALLRTPFAVVYNHEVWKDRSTTQSELVSEGTGLVRTAVARPAGAALATPAGVAIADPAEGGSGPVMTWNAVSGATQYLVNWRYGVRYASGANADRSHQADTSVTIPFGASRSGPITARVRAYSSSGVSDWSAERTWDSRPPTLSVVDTAVNEDDGSVGFLVTLDPAATGTVTVDYTTVDGTAVAGTDYTATSGTLTFAPGEREKKTALVPIADDDEADSGETFRLVLSNPTGSDRNNGAAVLGDAEAVATILNSEQEAAELTGFTLVDAGTTGDLMALAEGSTVRLGELLASSYGIRAEMSPGAAPGSVRLELSGAKTVAATDDAAPWSLYGDGAGRINGASLPPGSYTLTATAYADSGGRGEERGSLEVSFTVAAGVLSVTTPGPFTVAEGETAVAELAASKTGIGGTASWSIPAGTAGGADGAAFALTPEGVLSLVAAKDFEAPDDADGDGVWEVTVEAAVAAGAQSATAALLVTLTDVNEAPVAQASASPTRVREGVEVTLDGRESTDPDAGDTLTYAWTQDQDGAPRVVLSDANTAQPVFTSPSDLAAETELGFTLRVTDAAGLHAEATVTVTVTLISVVSIAAASDYEAEGAEAVFRLSRAGSALKALTVPVTVEETGAMLGADVPADATFAAGSREAELRLPTAADAVAENDSLVTVRLASGAGWQLAAGAASASLTVLDDDAAPVTGVSAPDVTIWSADMTVVEYGPRSIGAGTAAQFSNQQGRAGLRAKWLWYDPVARTLKLGFDDSLDDAEELTLHVGASSLRFPANSGGDSSFSLENVDVSWSDGETLAVRVSKPSAEAVSTDATLASLSVDGAALSPAFDAAVLVYRAVADAETVTVSATATDGGASLAYGPAEDADTELAEHQAAVPGEGEALVEVTVTAVDGTVRRYRVVVARAAVVDRQAPVLAAASVNGAVLTLTFSEALNADSKPAAGAFTVTVAGNARTVDAVALSGSAVTLTLASAVAADETVTVGYTAPSGANAVPLKDLAGNDAASFTGEAAANDTPASNTAPSGLPAITGTAQVGETLTASADAITDADGLESAAFAWQWLAVDGSEDTEIAGATGATHEVAPRQAGQTLKVRVTFTDDKGTEETLVSAATEPVAAVAPSAPVGLAVATAEGRERELSASWSAPQSDGGSEVTGYKVQWKSGTESYDGSESSARQAVLGATAASHTIAGLVNGTAYTVRVLAVNAAGAGAAAEVEATVRDRVAPVLAGAAVNGAVLTLTYSEALDTASKPAAGAFAVTAAGNARTVDAVALSGSAVTLTLASAVAAGETVTVGYTAPSGANAVPLKDLAGNDAASFTGEAAANDTPASNTAPSGLPEIAGTAQVGEVLTASADAITDVDGLDNAAFAWQWLAVDGTEDSEIAGATEATHEVAPQQAGQTLKVRVTFTDDKGTEETLVSAATEPVAPTVPSAPVGLAVATAEGRERELSVSWSAPQSDGGSEVTGYKVQWKSGTESYDGSESSARQAVLGATAASHAIAGLVNGTAYTVRVLAVNAAGAGAAAEVEATATDRVAPVLTGAVVDGTALTLTFSEALDADSKPAVGAFAVSVQGNARTVEAVALSGSAVDLTLAAAVVADETVTLGYTAPTGAGASPLQDASGNAVAGFSGAAVSNDTPAANAKPNGLPAITGTAQVGETLTASADAITDADGLENAAFAWQWLAVDGSEDTEIAGATGATHEVAPQQAGQTLKVRVTLTDDEGTEETLVSAATEVVTVPLTAVFENLPSAHDGASIFTFRVRFSESPAVSYKVLRDESFAVTGGSVDKARRVDGRNDLREIHVEPGGYDEVTLTLAGGRACGTEGAICTADGRALSNTLSATVQGPPALNVADARAVEGQDASLDFVVTLSRAASWTVSVDYATADGSAAAGEDYSATSGTLTFAAGETTKTVRVAVLDDVVNDGEETLTLTLSNPSGAWIEDGEASGTIENSDPLPTAWTARFGRSVASHVLDALEARLETASGSYVRLGGHQLGGAPDVREAVERLAPDDNLSLWEEGAADSASRNMTVQDLLLGSAFHLVSNPDAAATGPQLSAWGRVATSGFDGQQDRLSLNGTVTTATLGVDGVWEHWLTGVALAYSEGDGSFTQVEAAGGELASSLTSVHPYVAYALSDRVRLWGMVGYGSGSLQLKLAEQDAMDTDLAMTMGALGIRGSLLEPSQEGGMQLAVRSDVLWLRMDSAATAGLAATEADVSRLRLVLEGSRPISLAAGGSLVPTLEVGLRHDGGDAETGSGVEVGGSLRYTSAWGLSIEASVRGLLAHEAADYQEWGASGALRFDPGRQGLGLTASIAPTWGSAASGVERLWGQPDASGLAVGNPLATAAAGRLDAELGYGLAALRGRGLLTPYARMALSEGSEQAWHLGARLALPRSLNLSLEASRRARDGDAAAHEVALLATLGW